MPAKREDHKRSSVYKWGERDEFEVEVEWVVSNFSPVVPKFSPQKIEDAQEHQNRNYVDDDFFVIFHGRPKTKR